MQFQNEEEWWKVRDAAKSIEEAAGRIGKYFSPPQVAVVLGSGLGVFADKVTNAVKIPYGGIPYFPRSAAPGHAGRLVLGRVGNVYVAVMQGRVHHYEGWSVAEVVRPVRVLAELGIKTAIITNAAGGISSDHKIGGLAVISDHVNLLGMSPLWGPNDEKHGLRFPGMNAAYDPALREHAAACADELGLEISHGVYGCSPGPQYETPAEIRMMRAMGITLAGMSTVLEVIALRHRGVRCLGISLVTNLAAGLSPTEPSEQEVIEATERGAGDFCRLLTKIIMTLPAPAK